MQSDPSELFFLMNCSTHKSYCFDSAWWILHWKPFSTRMVRVLEPEPVLGQANRPRVSTDLRNEWWRKAIMCCLLAYNLSKKHCTSQCLCRDFHTVHVWCGPSPSVIVPGASCGICLVSQSTWFCRTLVCLCSSWRLMHNVCKVLGLLFLVHVQIYEKLMTFCSTVYLGSWLNLENRLRLPLIGLSLSLANVVCKAVRK